MGKVKDILRILENYGWKFINKRGSHRQFKHPTKPGRVTVPGNPADDMHPKTWKSVLRQAGLTQESSS